MKPRSRNPLALAAMGIALAAAMPAPVPVAQSAPVSQSPVREFIAPEKKQTRKQSKKKLKFRDPNRTKGQKWKDYPNGAAIDGRGDYRSPKRLQRQRLCALHGVTTGRQWVRLRRELRRAA